MQARKNDDDIGTVDKHLADARLAVLGDKDKVPITSEKEEIQASKDFHPRIRPLLRKHENLWY